MSTRLPNGGPPRNGHKLKHGKYSRQVWEAVHAEDVGERWTLVRHLITEMGRRIMRFRYLLAECKKERLEAQDLAEKRGRQIEAMWERWERVAPISQRGVAGEERTGDGSEHGERP